MSIVVSGMKLALDAKTLLDALDLKLKVRALGSHMIEATVYAKGDLKGLPIAFGTASSIPEAIATVLELAVSKMDSNGPGLSKGLLPTMDYKED